MVYIENRYRDYNTRTYTAMSSRCDLVIVWINPWPSNEHPPESLTQAIEWHVVSPNNMNILQPWHLHRTLKFIHTLIRASSHADLIISSTSDSWKSTVAYVIARSKNIPIALRKEKWCDHDLNLGILKRFYWKTILIIRNKIEHKVAAMLACGKKSREYLTRNGIPEDNIYEFPFNPPDMRELAIEHSTLKQLRELKGASLALLYLGRIMPQKGLLELIKTTNRLREEGFPCILLIVGAPLAHDTGRGAVSMHYYEECLEEAAKSQGGIHFLGSVDNNKVSTYYMASDIFVHPHVNAVDGREMSDGYGCVLIEAASMSLPIVVSNRVGAAEDIVCDSANGFIIDSRHLLDDLYAKLVWLLSNRCKLEEFGRFSRARYEERFNPSVNEHVLEQLLAVVGKCSSTAHRNVMEKR